MLKKQLNKLIIRLVKKLSQCPLVSFGHTIPRWTEEQWQNFLGRTGKNHASKMIL